MKAMVQIVQNRPREEFGTQNVPCVPHYGFETMPDRRSVEGGSGTQVGRRLTIVYLRMVGSIDLHDTSSLGHTKV